MIFKSLVDAFVNEFRRSRPATPAWRGPKAGPAPIGTPTRARISLLRQVSRGKVMWIFSADRAELIGADRNRTDVSKRFYELVAARWAMVPYPGPGQLKPYQAPCSITEIGEDMLMSKPTR